MRDFITAVRPLIGVGALLTAISLAGCAGSKEAQQAQVKSQALRSIGQAYHRFLKEKEYAPNNLEDIAELLPEDNKAEAYQAVSGGTIIVRWKLDPKTKDPAKTVLAYPLSARTAGGEVLKLDQSIVRMSAQELQDALQGKTK